jgi:hypothetical protein
MFHAPPAGPQYTGLRFIVSRGVGVVVLMVVFECKMKIRSWQYQTVLAETDKRCEEKEDGEPH